MYPLHLWHVADDVQRRRRHEADLHAARRRAARLERARQAPVEPGVLRRAVGFGLIEAGLRLLTARQVVQARRVR